MNAITAKDEALSDRLNDLALEAWRIDHMTRAVIEIDQTGELEHSAPVIMDVVQRLADQLNHALSQLARDVKPDNPAIDKITAEVNRMQKRRAKKSALANKVVKRKSAKGGRRG